MKIIDLLNKIANKEKVPKKIKWGSKTYKYNGRWEDYKDETYDEEYFFQTMLNRNRDMSLILTDEVEIIEEVEDKEYEDIEELNLDTDELLKKVVITAQDYVIEDKINALIRNQKKILERLDK